MALKLPKLRMRSARPEAAPPPPEPPRPPESSTVLRNATALIAVIVAGAALYWLRDIVTPLAMAIFLLIMIEGLTRWVEERFRLPGWAVAPVSLTLILLGFAGSIWVIIDGLAGIITQASSIGVRVNAIIADVAGLFEVAVPPTATDLLTRFDLASLAGQAALTTQSVFGGAFFALVYLAFLLAAKGSFRKKIVALFPLRDDRQEALQVFERMRGGVEGYLWVQTITGLMISAAAWLVMVLVGLDNALFWAFLIFLVGYIPVIGGAIAGLAPPLFALVQFDTYWQPIALLVALQTILFIVGNFIQPRMQGDNQNIDPVAVLLFLALWSALWGVAGAFLSTPIAVAIMAITAEFRGTRWIAVLLSGDGDPYPDDPEDRRLIADAKAERAARAR
ncbi:AI-2E family transporter [Brevundimonas sp.]|uniref:AI-2E family transporter n=1 Tax=Brevundimonas sp. TaxID=1871086 RepID=UPI0025EA01B6|nr:AI-2E family transporter [Brevundimonas sp.]